MTYLYNVLPWSQGAIDCSQLLKLQQLYQTTSNHSYTPYQEQESTHFSLCVQFSIVNCDNSRFKYYYLLHPMLSHVLFGMMVKCSKRVEKQKGGPNILRTMHCVVSGGFLVWHHYFFHACPFLQWINWLIIHFHQNSISYIQRATLLNAPLGTSQTKKLAATQCYGNTFKIHYAFLIYFSHPLSISTVNPLSLLLSLSGSGIWSDEHTLHLCALHCVI